MIEKKFADENIIAYLLLLNPARKIIGISTSLYYLLILAVLIYKYIFVGARVKNLLIILALTFSHLENVLNPYLYVVTLILSLLNLYYPLNVYELPDMSKNIGYKKLIIPGNYNSDACIFYPSTTGS